MTESNDMEKIISKLVTEITDNSTKWQKMCDN